MIAKTSVLYWEVIVVSNEKGKKNYNWVSSITQGNSGRIFNLCRQTATKGHHLVVSRYCRLDFNFPGRGIVLSSPAL